MSILNKNIGIPYYEQIMEEIKNDIKTNKYKYGELIPKEVELCKYYNVSRPTIRKALEILVKNGNLVRVKGKGTYVSCEKINQEFTKTILNFNQEMQLKGVVPQTKVLEFKILSANKYLSSKLDISLGEKIIYFQRLRFVNGEPILIVKTYLPLEKNEFLLKSNLEENSFYNLLKEQNIFIKKVHRVLETKKAPQEIADYLNIQKDDPIFYFETTAFTQNDTITEFSECHYRGDKNKFIIELENSL